MEYKNIDLDRIAKHLLDNIESKVQKAGIFYRIFHRCKTSNSLKSKLCIKDENGLDKYTLNSKLIQDVIGIRLNLYFMDDLTLVTSFLKKSLQEYFLDETIDYNHATEFKPTRINLVFKLPKDYMQEFREIIKDKRIDSTYELQIRTIFSEGWHEVEHDLRYKCKKDWENHHDLSRTFNGMLAALETHEWGMLQMFERLAFEQYKRDELNAMLRNKLRIRIHSFPIDNNLQSLFDNNKVLLKKIFKVDRQEVIFLLLKCENNFPKTITNIIYLINFFIIKDEDLLAKTPEILISKFNQIN
jgi:putative GTP pyrophosphokinase